MIQQQRLIDTFFQLVRVDSETKHEGEISKVLKQRFQEFGLTVQEDKSMEKTGHGANNLFFQLPASAGCEQVKPILFTCHMDTVTPGLGINPQQDADGYLRSDGTTILGADDKAGIAAMLEAIQVIRDQGLSHGPIQFVITAGEESGLLGSRALDTSLLNAELGFALDSNGPVGEIVVAGPSQSKIYATIIGKSAHAGVNPEDGISAIQVASKAVSRMPLGRIDEETTANIGRFEGGGETNIVCETLKVFAEARSLDNHKLEVQIEKMRTAFQSAADEHHAELEFISDIIYPGFKYGADAEVVKLAVSAVERIGRKPELLTSGGGSDANMFNGYGIPTVNLAIGYEHIHTTKEQILVTELVKTAELVLAIVAQTVELKH